MRTWRRNGVTIVAYHNIREQEVAQHYGVLGSPTTQEFEEQIAYLHEKYEIMSLPEVTERIRSQKTLPKRGAVVTFDDGYKSTYTCAYPILRKHSIPATVFLTTDHIGSDNPFWWDKVAHIVRNIGVTQLELEGVGNYSLTTISLRLAAIRQITRSLKKLPDERKNDLIRKIESLANGSLPLPSQTATLSWSDVEEMSRHDITFGAHTATHPILTRISPEQANLEIQQSKKDIEAHLNQPVTLFGYPNGERSDFNTDTKSLLRTSGFDGAVTLIQGINTARTDPYELRRFPGTGGSRDIFQLLISGAVPQFALALMANKVLR